MWEISSSLQLLNLFRAVVLGIIYCALYDVLKGLRLAINFSTLAVFIQDVLVSVSLSFITFLFLLSTTNGEVRGFVLFGMALGFILMRLTISVVLQKIFKKVFSVIKRLFNGFSANIYTSFAFVERKVIKNCKKTAKTVKKLLKNGKGLLYTKPRR